MAFGGSIGRASGAGSNSYSNDQINNAVNRSKEARKKSYDRTKWSAIKDKIELLVKKKNEVGKFSKTNLKVKAEIASLDAKLKKLFEYAKGSLETHRFGCINPFRSKEIHSVGSSWRREFSDSRVSLSQDQVLDEYVKFHNEVKSIYNLVEPLYPFNELSHLKGTLTYLKDNKIDMLLKERVESDKFLEKVVKKDAYKYMWDKSGVRKKMGAFMRPGKTPYEKITRRLTRISAFKSQLEKMKSNISDGELKKSFEQKIKTCNQVATVHLDAYFKDSKVTYDDIASEDSWRNMFGALNSLGDDVKKISTTYAPKFDYDIKNDALLQTLMINTIDNSLTLKLEKVIASTKTVTNKITDMKQVCRDLIDEYTTPKFKIIKTLPQYSSNMTPDQFLNLFERIYPEFQEFITRVQKTYKDQVVILFNENSRPHVNLDKLIEECGFKGLKVVNGSVQENTYGKGMTDVRLRCDLNQGYSQTPLNTLIGRHTKGFISVEAGSVSSFNSKIPELTAIEDDQFRDGLNNSIICLESRIETLKINSDFSFDRTINGWRESEPRLAGSFGLSTTAGNTVVTKLASKLKGYIRLNSQIKPFKDYDTALLEDILVDYFTQYEKLKSSGEVFVNLQEEAFTAMKSKFEDFEDFAGFGDLEKDFKNALVSVDDIKADITNELGRTDSEKLLSEIIEPLGSVEDIMVKLFDFSKEEVFYGSSKIKDIIGIDRGKFNMPLQNIYTYVEEKINQRDSILNSDRKVELKNKFQEMLLEDIDVSKYVYAADFCNRYAQQLVTIVQESLLSGMKSTQIEGDPVDTYAYRRLSDAEKFLCHKEVNSNFISSIVAPLGGIKDIKQEDFGAVITAVTNGDPNSELLYHDLLDFMASSATPLDKLCIDEFKKLLKQLKPFVEKIDGILELKKKQIALHDELDLADGASAKNINEEIERCQTEINNSLGKDRNKAGALDTLYSDFETTKKELAGFIPTDIKFNYVKDNIVSILDHKLRTFEAVKGVVLLSTEQYLKDNKGNIRNSFKDASQNIINKELSFVLLMIKKVHEQINLGSSEVDVQRFIGVNQNVLDTWGNSSANPDSIIQFNEAINSIFETATQVDYKDLKSHIFSILQKFSESKKIGIPLDVVNLYETVWSLPNVEFIVVETKLKDELTDFSNWAKTPTLTEKEILKKIGVYEEKLRTLKQSEVTGGLPAIQLRLIPIYEKFLQTLTQLRLNCVKGLEAQLSDKRQQFKEEVNKALSKKVLGLVNQNKMYESSLNGVSSNSYVAGLNAVDVDKHVKSLNLDLDSKITFFEREFEFHKANFCRQQLQVGRRKKYKWNYINFEQNISLIKASFDRYKPIIISFVRNKLREFNIVISEDLNWDDLNGEVGRLLAAEKAKGAGGRKPLIEALQELKTRLEDNIAISDELEERQDVHNKDAIDTLESCSHMFKSAEAEANKELKVSLGVVNKAIKEMDDLNQESLEIAERSQISDIIAPYDDQDAQDKILTDIENELQKSARLKLMHHRENSAQQQYWEKQVVALREVFNDDLADKMRGGVITERSYIPLRSIDNIPDFDTKYKTYITTNHSTFNENQKQAFLEKIMQTDEDRVEFFKSAP